MASGDSAWHTFQLVNGLGVAIRVVERDDGELVIGDLYLNADRITPELLRSVPLARFETMVNRFDSVERLRFKLGEGNGGTMSVDELRESLELSRRMFAGRVRRVDAAGDELVERPRLARPDGTDPDGFYRQVADAYQEYAAITKAAAVQISEEAGVPVTTAHRWIREARRRGFLPEGQKGRTG